jgi:outer membrane receptor protein involved in Fe transport
MRFFRLQGIALVFAVVFALGFVVATQQPSAYCQETTGGLQGTVKDPTGAVVPKARVTLTGTTLIGTKELVTDSSGYYRFANLPPGAYSIVVKAEGFETSKQSGITIQMERVANIDIVLKVGATATTVEVTGSAPVIDTTTTQNITDLSNQTLQNVPTGITYQSVIQYAPMARNEPLDGMSLNGMGVGGGGGSMPGSSGNGLSIGYSIGGAADSESSYLVEGQDTENISGGYSNANVPMDFIDTVEMKTSGVEAEYGGAIGGVVNVVMKKGGNQFHGSLFSTYESSGTDANPVNPYVRYDPTQTGIGPGSSTTVPYGLDPGFQDYQAQKAHFRDTQPGVLVGGPIVKDRLWFIAGFNPLYNDVAESVNFGGSSGEQYFTSDKQTYYGYGRLDAALTQKIRVYASWLYQDAREAGDSFPIGDPEASESSYLNTSTFSPLSEFSHGLGWSAPNETFNVGADITLTQHLISTTRYGYFFNNYHDFGWPTVGANLDWAVTSTGATDNTGAPLPAALQQGGGTTTTAFNSTNTTFNANKHYQFNQDFAFYKGGWWGTHNFKFGYQLNHLINIIQQVGNVPLIYMLPGAGIPHGAGTAVGAGNCAKLETNTWGICAGQYGWAEIYDAGTILRNISTGAISPASDWNHALYAQDSWNIGKGLTLDVGLRIEHETLPAPANIQSTSFVFPWSDKIEPRLGAAWDPSRRGKEKIFGSYGVTNDVMKLLVAQTSWGGQFYEICSYPLGPDGTPAGFVNSDLDTTFVNGRACPTGAPTLGANFANGEVPTSFTDAKSGVQLIENINERPWEPLAPNVKPYRQHEYVAGFDYQISRNWAFEARYDRRRLDHIIEDSSLADTNNGEMYSIVNPGEGVDQTLDGYASYLASLGSAFGLSNYGFNAAAFGTCPSCPPQPKAIRNYDGVEFRFTLTPTTHWAALLSYTYSSLWGNYAGLTTTDQSDGGTTGRDSPDTSRAFDEPFYYYGANGKSTAGPMPTDRPNVFKGYSTYTFHWWKGMATTFGLSQQFLQGSPMSSWVDLLAAYPGEPYEATYIYGRGQWVNPTVSSTGAVTLGTPSARRTPWYTQSDLNAVHTFKVGDHESINIEGTALNALNQHAVTSYWDGLDSLYFATPLSPGSAGLYSGAATYQELETGYNPQTFVNGTASNGNSNMVLSSEYGHPYLFQLGRQFRVGVHYTF